MALDRNNQAWRIGRIALYAEGFGTWQQQHAIINGADTADLIDTLGYIQRAGLQRPFMGKRPQQAINRIENTLANRWGLYL